MCAVAIAPWYPHYYNRDHVHLDLGKNKSTELPAARAKNMRVYVSGIIGQQSLETGVAYHYRGHYIYAFPAGNPRPS